MTGCRADTDGRGPGIDPVRTPLSRSLRRNSTHLGHQHHELALVTQVAEVDQASSACNASLAAALDQPSPPASCGFRVLDNRSCARVRADPTCELVALSPHVQLSLSMRSTYARRVRFRFWRRHLRRRHDQIVGTDHLCSGFPRPAPAPAGAADADVPLIEEQDEHRESDGCRIALPPIQRLGLRRHAAGTARAHETKALIFAATSSISRSSLADR